MERMSDNEKSFAINASAGMFAINGMESNTLDTAVPMRSQPISPQYIFLSCRMMLKYVLGGNITFKSLDPSRGGIGSKLKIARPTFTA